MNRKLFFALILTACSLSVAQLPGTPRNYLKGSPKSETGSTTAKKESPKGVVDSPVSSDCAFNFSTGVNNTFLSYCVSANANIPRIETPQGHLQISQDRNNGEGYGVCDDTTSTVVGYTDYGSDGGTGNWGSATVVKSDQTSVKIARTTSDGIWTLMQTINMAAGPIPFAKVTMTLKNNTAIPRQALLMRYADVDADGVGGNNLDSTLNTAAAWNGAFHGNPFGLILQNIGNAPANVSNLGFIQRAITGPDPCNAFAFLTTDPINGDDGSVVMLYAMDVPKAGSKTITVGYRGM